MTNQQTENTIKRHMAKLLTRLDDANCPEIYISDIKRQFHFLRDDLCNESEDYDRKTK